MAKKKKGGGKAAKIHAKVSIVPIKSLKPNAWNPNIVPRDMLASIVAGIKRRGFIGPITVQKGTGIIVDGEHRWIAAKRCGLTKIPVIEIEIDDAGAKELTIALNQKRGYFDPDKVSELVQEIASDLDETRRNLQVVLGFSGKEIDDMLQEAATAAEKHVSKTLKKESKKKTPPAKKEPPPKAPEEPDEDDGKEEETPEVVGGGEGPDYRPKEDKTPRPGKYPFTFYAPTEDDYLRMRALFTNGKTSSFDFKTLKKVVEVYFGVKPAAKKKAEKKAAQLGA